MPSGLAREVQLRQRNLRFNPCPRMGKRGVQVNGRLATTGEGKRTGNGEKGFSMIEMMVVVAVVMVVFGMAIIQLRPTLADADMDAAMRQVLDQIRQAREYSIAKRRYIQVQFKTVAVGAGNQYQVITTQRNDLTSGAGTDVYKRQIHGMVRSVRIDGDADLVVLRDSATAIQAARPELMTIERPLGERFYRALAYAARVHGRQFRKGTSRPYVSHLLGVTSIVLVHGGDEDEAIAALLHDAVEDQGGKRRLRDIRAKFGKRVAKIVEGCTDSDETPKPPWLERKKEYLRHLRGADSSVRLVDVYKRQSYWW